MSAPSGKTDQWLRPCRAREIAGTTVPSGSRPPEQAQRAASHPSPRACGMRGTRGAVPQSRGRGAPGPRSVRILTWTGFWCLRALPVTRDITEGQSFCRFSVVLRSMGWFACDSGVSVEPFLLHPVSRAVLSFHPKLKSSLDHNPQDLFSRFSQLM